MGGQPTSPEPCPKCGTPSPCTDWNEVDIGPGVQYFDYRYTCPTHGEYAYPNAPYDHENPAKAIFRDEDPNETDESGRKAE